MMTAFNGALPCSLLGLMDINMRCSQSQSQMHNLPVAGNVDVDVTGPPFLFSLSKIKEKSRTLLP